MNKREITDHNLPSTSIIRWFKCFYLTKEIRFISKQTRIQNTCFRSKTWTFNKWHKYLMLWKTLFVNKLLFSFESHLNLLSKELIFVLFGDKMAAFEKEGIQKQIQQDWANREYIEIITGSIKKIADFLNSFGLWFAFVLHTISSNYCFVGPSQTCPAEEDSQLLTKSSRLWSEG